MISSSCHLNILSSFGNCWQLLSTFGMSPFHHLVSLTSCHIVILFFCHLVSLAACQFASFALLSFLTCASWSCLLDLIQSYLCLIVREIKITKVCNWGQFNLCCIYMYYIWHVFLFVLPFVFHFTVFVFVGGRSDLCFQQHGSSESRGAWSVDSKLWAF